MGTIDSFPAEAWHSDVICGSDAFSYLTGTHVQASVHRKKPVKFNFLLAVYDIRLGRNEGDGSLMVGRSDFNRSGWTFPY